ncbi:MAG: BspA family leucine-rich repeat surface protein [Clostridium sp.]|nr:BspA family leucine-rich repeat surface protein [Clostridium sp.]
MKSNITKLSIIAIISLFTLAVIGLSYAYFSTEITGEGKYVILDTATLKLKYTDNTVLSLDNAIPGDFVTKTFTVENIGTKKVSYNIVWNNLINTINNYDLHLDMKCKSYKNYNTSSKVESGECSSFYKAVPYTETSISKDIKRNNEIDIGITHEYTVTITFKNRPYLQNNNLNKSFSGKIDLEEYVDPSPEAVYCTFDGTLTQGTEYVNGQYTYRYMQEVQYGDLEELEWQNITSDGWGVQLTDKASTDAVTSKVCTYINNKPITSMSFMFSNSQATTLDVSNFDTSNVTNMLYMFFYSQATTLDVSNFNTSNVTNMYGMFSNSQATTLDVSNFDTSKVTNMSMMFKNSQATTLDVSNFNTSNVTNMSSMFFDSQATTLDVSNFDTSKVTDMSGMFFNSQVTTLDVSNFNTSNVTDMNYMFYGSQVTTLDVSNFDTSNVTDMRGMFSGSQATILDLSSFNTSNVTDMSGMFYGSQVTTLDVSNFNTSNVTDMSKMFFNSKATTLDVSNFDTSKVTNMDNMFYNSTNLKTIYVSNKFNTDKVTTSASMFDRCTNLVGGAGTKYDSTKTDKTYAHIDGGTSNPGYFTAK